MYKEDLENAEEPEIKLPASFGSHKNQGDSIKKTTISGNFPVSPAIETLCFHCMRSVEGDWIPDWGAKTPQAAHCSKKKGKKKPEPADHRYYLNL